jgi:hypothetical protein
LTGAVVALTLLNGAVAASTWFEALSSLKKQEKLLPPKSASTLASKAFALLFRGARGPGD